MVKTKNEDIKRRQKNNLKNTISMMSFFSLSIMIINFMLSILLNLFSNGSHKRQLMSMMAITLFSILLPTIIMERFFGKKNYCSNLKKSDMSVCILHILFGFGFCITMNYILNLVSTIFPQFGNTSIGVIYNTDIVTFLLMIISVCVVPAVCEELAFRNCVIGNLFSFGDGAAIIFSASVFGILHMGNAEMIFAFSSGIVFGFIRKNTGRIFPSIIVHFLNNFLAVISGLLTSFLTRYVYILLYQLVSIFGFSIMLISMLFLHKKNIKVVNVNSNGCVLSIKEKLYTILLGSPMLWVLVVCAVIIKFI